MTLDYAVYDKMSEEEREAQYPSCKVVIRHVDGGSERLWARELGPDLVMLNNDPIDNRYRYADVVRLEGSEVRTLEHRTFLNRYGFMWTSAPRADDDLKLRQKIFEACLTLGSARHSLSFFRPGIGFLLTIADVTQDLVLNTLCPSTDALTNVAQFDDAGKPNVIWYRSSLTEA